MDTHLSQDGVDQLALRQGKVKIMVARENVANQQRHPNLCEDGHAVHMIRTCLHATLRAKSCPGTHSSWLMASSLNPEAWLLL